jgi:hypothetical protein
MRVLILMALLATDCYCVETMIMTMKDPGDRSPMIDRVLPVQELIGDSLE